MLRYITIGFVMLCLLEPLAAHLPVFHYNTAVWDCLVSTLLIADTWHFTVHMRVPSLDPVRSQMSPAELSKDVYLRPFVILLLYPSVTLGLLSTPI